jgi:hypothetical protein
MVSSLAVFLLDALDHGDGGGNGIAEDTGLGKLQFL